MDAPASARKGSVITIRIGVFRKGNSFFHYTDRVCLEMNGREVRRRPYAFSNRPEAENFTKEVAYKVDGPLEIKARARCNVHGSAGRAARKVRAE